LLRLGRLLLSAEGEPTEGASFAPFEDEFFEVISRIVWCTVTTVDPADRPRSRILHPVWELIDGLPVGWAMTTKTRIKAAHLVANPKVAVMYWSPDQDTVSLQCTAAWVDDDVGKQHVWDLFASTPPPLGYSPAPYGSIENPVFNPLRFDATLVQIVRGEDVWNGHFSGRTWRLSERSA
jgi:hypothetical protein